MFIPTVAGGHFGINSGCVEDAGVVLVDNASHILHAALTNVYGVTVDYLA